MGFWYEFGLSEIDNYALTFADILIHGQTTANVFVFDNFHAHNNAAPTNGSVTGYDGIAARELVF